MHTITSTTSVPASNQQLIAKLQQQAQAQLAARQQAIAAAASVLFAQSAAPPAHKAASTGTTGTGRGRTGTNQQYNAIVGNLRPTALAQLMGFWGYTKEQAQRVCLAYWPSVNLATVNTGRADGATKGYRKDGGVYKDYKVPAIMAALGANVDAVQQAIENCLQG
jgi:hypothetical protein